MLPNGSILKHYLQKISIDGVTLQAETEGVI